MRMWSMNFMILLLFCYACVSTSKGKVYFVSKNFFNVLHWDPPKNTSPSENVHYSVSYKQHTKESHTVKACQNITALSCDLTAFTPTIHDCHYYACVFANGGVLGYSTRFNPLAETVFGSPNLTIRTTASHLHVNVTLPLGPKGVSIADILKTEFSKVVFDYNLKITEPKWAAHDVRNNTSGQFNITLRSNQRYCGYVVYRPSVQWNRESEKAQFCVTMPGKPPTFLPWIVLGGVVLMVLIVLSAVCACIYTKGGKPKTMPQSLVAITGNQDVPSFSDKNLVISKPVIISQSDDHKTVYAKILVSPTSSSPGVETYSPQEIPHPPWQDMVGSSNPNPVLGNRSSQFSEIYSSIAVNIPNEEEEDEEAQQAEEDMETNHTPEAVSDGSLDDNSSASTVPDRSTVENNPDNQIILNVFRDNEGNLVLPSLRFELHSRTGDSAESALTAETKPLLSDILISNGEPMFVSSESSGCSECSDSGCDDSTFNTPTDLYCNTNYFPATVYSPSMHLEPQSGLPANGSLEPDYKPNWPPSVHHDPAEALNYPFAWNGDRMEEEVKEDKGNMEEEDLTEILLGNWKLQVQE